MSLRYLGGFITASYNPLKVPNPPTIGTVTPGSAQVSVAFTAPSNVGGSAITSFLVLVTDSSSGATFSNTGSASPIVVTGLTNGNTYTAKVLAVNSYGPSAFSAPSGSFSPATLGLFSWGNNNFGQLGLNTVDISQSSPVQVGALITWNEVFSGNYHSAAIKTDGTLWTWGSGSSGRLGHNNNINQSSPVQVGALTTWVTASCSTGSTFAIKTDGTLWSWGQGNQGILGSNSTTDKSSPVQVGSLTNWSKVSASSQSNSCAAIKTDGTLWTWGYNTFGQLGQGTAPTSKSSPVQVGALTNWSQVSTCFVHMVAVNTSGQLFTWGYGFKGQLGNNSTTDRSSPVQVGALTTWSKVAAGYTACAAIKTDGTLWTWGGNNNGQLGTGNPNNNQSSPVQVGALTTWSQVSSASYSCAAIKTDGTLWSWGINTNGRLGLNDTVTKSSPVQVGALTDWSQVSAGGTFAIGILS